MADTNVGLYEQLSAGELFPVGFPVLLNRYADTNLLANKYIASRMKMVDLIPVGFILNYKSLFTTDSDPNNSSAANTMTYEFEYFVNEYRKKLKNLGIFDNKDQESTTFGVRLWITGDSSGTDSVANNYTNNAISEMIKTQVQNLGVSQLQQLAKSMGYGNLASGYNNSSSKGARAMLNLLFEGKHVSLPQIWQDSSYSSNYNFTVKLSSPYGSMEAIQRFIAEPLLRLMALASSSSDDGITYGNPSYLYVRGYGLTFMKLGIPKNIQISRGAEDRINKYKQPLDIVITLTLDNAIPGFAALIGPEDTSGGIVGGVTEDVQLADIAKRVNGVLTPPQEWGEFGGTDEQTQLKDLLKSTKNGPALNTVGSILKSLFPSPPSLASESYDGWSLQAPFIADTVTTNSELNSSAFVRTVKTEADSASAPSISYQLQDLNMLNLFETSLTKLNLS